MEEILFILIVLYMVVGIGIAIWAAQADEKAKEIVLTTNPLYKIITVICICLWPFLILFYFIFKKQIALAKGEKDRESEEK